MPTNLTLRYSQLSPVGSTVLADNLILVGQPDPTNTKTGYGVYKATIAQLSSYFKSVLRNEGLKGIITLGDGIIGDGSPGSIELDEEWFDRIGIRHDKLNLSTVGDRTFPVLPLSGSYFSINYPYDSLEQAAVAYTETSGDVLVLAPVTNGFEKRYTYTTLKNWSSGRWTAENSDTVYQVPGLNPSEYVSAMFPPSETAMVVEITDSITKAIEYGVVLLSGTLSYQYHTLIRTGSAIPAWLNGDPNLHPRILQDRPPAVYLRNGRIIIVGALQRASANGVSLRWAEVNRNTGELRPIQSVRINGRSNSEVRSDGVMDVTRGFFTTDPASVGFELIGDKAISATSATAGAGGGAFRSIGVAIAQSKHGVRLALRRAESMNYSEGNASAPYFYTFTTVYDIYEEPALHGAEIYLSEVDNSIGMRHTCELSLTSIKFSSDYIPDRNGTFSSAQSPQYTFLGDGSMFVSSASTSAATNARNYIYRGKKGMDAWSAAYNIREPASSSAGISTTPGLIPSILPALTPIVARAGCNYLATNMAQQNMGDAGSILTYNTNYAAENKPPAYAKVKGYVFDSTYELVDYGTINGYTLNNDRGIIEMQQRATTSFQDKNGVIRHSHTFFSNLETAGDYTQNYEIGIPYQVLKTITLPQAVRDRFVSDVMAKFAVGDRALTYRFTCLPGDPENRALFVVTVADKENAQSFRAYGAMKMTTTANGNALTITGLDITNAQYHQINLNSAYFIYFVYPFNCGWAAVQNSDGVLDFLVKEGTVTAAKNGAGGGVAGVYLMKHELNGSITYVKGINSLDFTSSVLYPTVGPRNMGLATIDATAGYGTNYVLRPVTPTGDAAIDKGILIGSPTPSQTFTVNIGGDIPVQLNGALGDIPAQSIDLAAYSNGEPANKTFYFYAVEVNKKVEMDIRTTPVNETLSRTLFAVVVTNSEVITSVKATPFSRLGLYRLSNEPRGSSVACTQGSFADYVDRFWLTRWYGGGDENWDDYFIPEQITEGEFVQVLILAPDATFEMMMHAPGGGGGGSRYTGGNYDPAMDGKDAGYSMISINNATVASFFPAKGGTEGWWGNGSHFANGVGGAGGSVGLVESPPATAQIEVMQYATGGAGKGAWDRDSAGGVRGTFPNPAQIPSYVPALPNLGYGGNGALGVGDEGLSYGGGGGAGGSFFMRVKNTGTGPLSITVMQGESGAGGISGRNGQAGRAGVVWWRQIPKT